MLYDQLEPRDGQNATTRVPMEADQRFPLEVDNQRPFFISTIASERALPTRRKNRRRRGERRISTNNLIKFTIDARGVISNL